MVEHLRELRTRLVISVAAFFVISIVLFFFFSPIFSFLRRPLCGLPEHLLGATKCHLIVTGILEPFQVRLKVTALIGIAASSPIWLYELWAFVAPGLKPKERKYAIPFVATSILLFLIGCTFAYLTLPAALRFLIGIGGSSLSPFLKADSYFNFVGLVMLAFGTTFELPLLLLFMGIANIVTVEQLRHHRKAAIVGIFVLAAVVTPSQDPYTMTAMALPLWGMFELTILLLALITRKRGS
ncbi:MAG: twin-arginine translocase subunit TatC [Actinomycetota bacterium]